MLKEHIWFSFFPFFELIIMLITSDIYNEKGKAEKNLKSCTISASHSSASVFINVHIVIANPGAAVRHSKIMKCSSC